MSDTRAEDKWYGRYMQASKAAHDFQQEIAVLTAERNALQAQVKALEARTLTDAALEAIEAAIRTPQGADK